jgi:hypothetical protein
LPTSAAVNTGGARLEVGDGERRAVARRDDDRADLLPQVFTRLRLLRGLLRRRVLADSAVRRRGEREA